MSFENNRNDYKSIKTLAGKDLLFCRKYQLLKCENDIDFLLRHQSSNPEECFTAIGETARHQYILYKEASYSSGYILRRRKGWKHHLTYYDIGFDFNSVYLNHLFRVDETGPEISYPVIVTNLHTGKEKEYRWFSKNWIMPLDASYSNDSVTNMSINKDGNLDIMVHRQEAYKPVYEAQYNYEMDYHLIVTYDGHDFRATAYYPPKKGDRKENDASGTEELTRSSKMDNCAILDCRCDLCGKHDKLHACISFELEKPLMRLYQELADEFTANGYPAKLKGYCRECANKLNPTRQFKNRRVFSVYREDCNRSIDSFPADQDYDPFDYRVTLEIVKGNDTIEKLTEITKTNYSAERYLEAIRRVLGDDVATLDRDIIMLQRKDEEKTTQIATENKDMGSCAQQSGDSTHHNPIANQASNSENSICAQATKQHNSTGNMDNFEESIRKYKRATFVNPSDVDAWSGLAKAYAGKKEYNNALTAIEKTLSIFPNDKEAMLTKTEILLCLKKTKEAIQTLDHLLEIHPDEATKRFRDRLSLESDSLAMTLDSAIKLMTERAYQVCMENELLNDDGGITLEEEINQQTDFVNGIMAFCKKQYPALGSDKVLSESIFAAFYGALAMTLMYYKDPSGFSETSPFQYLSDHADLGEIERKAELMLGYADNSKEAQELWDIIYQYVTFCRKTIAKIRPETDVNAAVQDACESAYAIGMLLAMRANEEVLHTNAHKQNKVDINRSNIDSALEKVSQENPKDEPPKERSAMCYSIAERIPLSQDRRIPVQATVPFRCDHCGKVFYIQVNNDDSRAGQIIERYKSILPRFKEFGYTATMHCYCDNCAKRFVPEFGGTLKTLTVTVTKDSTKVSKTSFLMRSAFNPFPLNVALASLRGARTIEQLKAATETDYPDGDYYKIVRRVLGENASEIIGDK